MTERVWAVVLVSAALAAFPSSIAAQAYRWVDAHGGVHYSDRPPKPEEEVGPPAPPRGAEAEPAAPPEAPPRAAAATVEELLELSGMKAQLVGMASRLGGELRPAKGQMSPQDQAAVDRTLTQALRHERLYTLIRDELRRDVDQAKLAAAVEWLRSPVARKIVALEVSSENGTDQKMATYTAGLTASPPPAQRVELLQKLDWISGTTEASTDITAAITRGVMQAVSVVSPPEQRLRPGQIESRVAELRARTGEALRQVQLVTMLYTYQSLEDAELGEYVRFSASEAGRWYNARMHKALVSAIGTVVERTTAELVRAVPLERWPRVAEPAPRKVK